MGNHNQNNNANQKSRLSEQVYISVVSNITNGKYKPSRKITERELAETFGISHVPVREAMEKLEQQGWIVRVPWKGAYVTDFDITKLQTAYKLREVIEIGAVNIVARQITDDQIAELKKATDMLESARQAGNAEVFKEADTQFHKLIVHFVGNKRLDDFFASAIQQAGAFYMISWVDAMQAFVKKDNALDYIEPMTHTNIFEAIAAHDDELAVNLLKNHFQHSQAIAAKMAKIHYELNELPDTGAVNKNYLKKRNNSNEESR